jgi:hypothetical protein
MFSIITMASSTTKPTAAVEGHVEHGEQEDRDGEDDGDHEEGHQCDLHAAQEDQQHHPGQRDSDQDGIADAVGRRRDELALVVPVAHLHPGRKVRLEVRELRLDVLDDPDGVPTGLLVDLEGDGPMAVPGHADPLGNAGPADGGDVREGDQPVPAGAEHRMLDLVEAPEPGIREHQVELVVVLELAHRLEDVGGGERLHDVVQAESVGAELGGVHGDPVLALASAEDAHLGDPVDRGEQGDQLVLGDLVQLHQVHGLRGEDVGRDGEDRRVHSPRLERRAGRKLSQGLRDGGLDVEERLRHVAAPVEVDGELGAPAARRRSDRPEARDAANRLLHRTGHFGDHLLRGPVSRVQHDLDAREVHLRKQRHGQAQHADESAGRQDPEQEEDRPPVAGRPLGSAHRGDSRTMAPSLSS